MLSTAGRCSARSDSARSRSPTTRFFCTSASRASFSSSALSASSARRSHFRLGVEVVDLLAQHLLGGDALDQLFLRGPDWSFISSTMRSIDLLRILRLVEERVHVAGDDLAHPVEDAHGPRVPRRTRRVKSAPTCGGSLRDTGSCGRAFGAGRGGPGWLLHAGVLRAGVVVEVGGEGVADAGLLGRGEGVAAQLPTKTGRSRTTRGLRAAAAGTGTARELNTYTVTRWPS